MRKNFLFLIYFILMGFFPNPLRGASKRTPEKPSSLALQILKKKDSIRLKFQAPPSFSYTIAQSEKTIEVIFSGGEGLIKVSGPQDEINVIGNNPSPPSLKIETKKLWALRDVRQGNSVIIDLYPDLSKGKASQSPPPPLPEKNKPSSKSPPYSLEIKNQVLSLNIPNPQKGGAAIFPYDGKIYVFIEGLSPPSSPQKVGHHGVVEIQGSPPSGLIITPEEGYFPLLQKKPNQWVLTFTKQDLCFIPGTQNLIPLIKTKSNGQKYLFFPYKKGGETLSIKDPILEGSLFIVPFKEVDFYKASAFKNFQFHLIPTWLGLVIKPLCDDLEIRKTSEGIEIQTMDGLWLSGLGFLEHKDHLVQLSSFFDLEGMGYPKKTWLEVRRMLDQDCAQCSLKEKKEKQLRLVKFYVGTDFIEEAKEILKNMEKKNPFLKTDPQFMVYKGLVCFLKGENMEALNAFNLPALQDEGEIQFWRQVTILSFSEEDPDDTMIKNILKKKSYLQSYPPFVRNRFIKNIIGPSLKGSVSNDLLNDLKELLSLSGPDDPNNSWTFQKKIFEATLYEREKKFPSSQKILQEISHKGDPKSKTQARLRLMRMEYDEKKLSPQKALQELEDLRYQWRGDDLERTILEEIGRLSFQEGQYRKSFETLESILLNFPTHSKNYETRQELERQFNFLFRDRKAKNFPMIKLLSLYDDMKKYAPPHEDTLPIVRYIATQLEKIDLVHEALVLLQDSLGKTEGLVKVDLGAQLANLYIKNNRPQKALEILSQTAPKKDIANQVPSALSQKRRFLEAKADGQLGHYEEAALLVKQDETPEVLLLKRDLYLASAQWSEAAQVLREIIDTPSFPKKDLKPEERRVILDLVVSASLAKQKNYLAYLRERYKPLMDKTEDQDTFDLMTTPDESLPPLSAKTVETLLRKAEKFSQILEGYRKRL